MELLLLFAEAVDAAAPSPKEEGEAPAPATEGSSLSVSERPQRSTLTAGE